jgi:hypothetical protein
MTANVMEIFATSRALPQQKRLLLARMLLDSVLETEGPAQMDQADWLALSLSRFQEGLDNDEDAIYDDWRGHYHVSAK